MFIYAINSILNLVKLAQLIEQWTNNSEVWDKSLPSNHFNFQMLMEFVLISFNKPDVHKT